MDDAWIAVKASRLAQRLGTMTAARNRDGEWDTYDLATLKTALREVADKTRSKILEGPPQAPMHTCNIGQCWICHSYALADGIEVLKKDIETLESDNISQKNLLISCLGTIAMYSERPPNKPSPGDKALMVEIRRVI